MRTFTPFLALLAGVLGNPIESDQSSSRLELNTRQTASGCYHQYVSCFPNLLFTWGLHVREW
ncbi:hypothetical protein ARSEF1564_010235 [Beauveria bassiana]